MYLYSILPFLWYCGKNHFDFVFVII